MKKLLLLVGMMSAPAFAVDACSVFLSLYDAHMQCNGQAVKNLGTYGAVSKAVVTKLAQGFEIKSHKLELAMYTNQQHIVERIILVRK